MTTIIGLQGKGWSIIGSDSKISSFDDQGYITSQTTLPKHSSKVTEKNGYLLGAAGDVRAINLLHHVYEPPSARYATTREKIDQHITKRVIPTLRQCFDEQGFSPPEKGDRDHKAEHNSTVIVSLKARIYVIESDYSWTEDGAGVYVIGTGHQFARAAMHMLLDGTDLNKLNQKRAIPLVEKSLEVACLYDPYSGGPFHIYTQSEAE
jgi:ATP-dependent protease HslVU (ClpYQ) peptidase subunit